MILDYLNGVFGTSSSYPRYNNNWWSHKPLSRPAGCTFPGTALAAHIMGLKTFWNNDAFFDYCDRYMAMIVVVVHMSRGGQVLTGRETL